MDDGPLTPEKVQTIQRIANEQAFQGPTLRQQSILGITEQEYADLLQQRTADHH